MAKRCEQSSVTSVRHKGLLHKLRGIGCSEHVLKWFTNYLSGRRQRVVLNSESSDRVEVEAGGTPRVNIGPTFISSLHK